MHVQLYLELNNPVRAAYCSTYLTAAVSFALPLFDGSDRIRSADVMERLHNHDIRTNNKQVQL